ncbi:MAG: 30S ribosomal protein S16 [Candidatus Saccharimonadales bacterium]|jgi:small subunit ribosomal protein S16
MLAIRLQRTGRSGHAQFRVIVQDDRFSPKSGRVVAYVGNYDPHVKTAKLDSEKIGQYLASGAQPSERVAQLLKKEGIKLPGWVKSSEPQKRTVRHPEKLRRNRPAGTPALEPVAAAPTEEPANEQVKAASVEPETPAPAAGEVPAEPETPAEEPVAEPAAEAPAEETPEEKPEPEITAEQSAEDSEPKPADNA